jgi:glutamate/tyrosine decarboxylase-like PLP-dependent enzyme
MMAHTSGVGEGSSRSFSLDLRPDQFSEIGNGIVERAAELFHTLPSRPVTKGEPPEDIRALLGDGPVPQKGTDPEHLVDEVSSLLIQHSLFNGHPKFWGYITSSAAPIGVLGEMLAASINPNVGAFNLSPVATEIERQTMRWVAEMLDYPPDCGGILVSGGNMANFVGFIVGCHAQVPWNLREQGWNGKPAVSVYASEETHGWLQKAADLFGLGTSAIRWIPVDEQLRMRTDALRQLIEADKKRNVLPLMVIGTAGSVATGAIDPLPEIASVCREHKLWFHVDGAYGGFAAILPDVPSDLKGLALADSVAVDPHKWLYAPLEAGCTLVRKSELLKDTFSFHASYYRFDETGGEPPVNFHEFGPQNSRGFRALKVWLALRQAGRDGYEKLIGTDISLAKEMYRAVSAHPQLEAFTQGLSITTFRYVPADIQLTGTAREEYLNDLNAELLDQLQRGGEAFLSNAIVGGRFLLRACIVNFRTTLQDVRELPDIVVRYGHDAERKLFSRRPVNSKA